MISPPRGPWPGRRGCLALALWAGLAGAATGQSADQCGVPDYLTHPEGKLPQVSRSVGENRLKVLVVGTGSSRLAGQRGTSTSYPARLEAALKERLPQVAVELKVLAKPRWPAVDMARELGPAVAEDKPDLVIWQTGTVDAMRGVDADFFRLALEKAVRKLVSAGIDVILMNMQYSPRTESMITVGPYIEAMRWVAQQQDVPLFDRLAIMKHWSEHGVFDLSAADGAQTAERVHDCLGRLLAQTIVEIAGLPRSAGKDVR